MEFVHREKPEFDLSRIHLHMGWAPRLPQRQRVNFTALSELDWEPVKEGMHICYFLTLGTCNNLWRLAHFPLGNVVA